ncbi:hypothetical protein DNHGIG_33330 [Collibacillus ludicampi]|uniref:DUF2197 domain-containing protein n=1 Tax=Collibacillus ludicampi TaxID=2771369 RepID=A0AAV4LK42_9BACL|nr:hypothetical protein DNHGIG_33330 [Collibacillus ludicampi]
MVDEPNLNCVICGKRISPEPTALDQLQASKNQSIYICPPCANKVRNESDVNL